MRLEAVVHNNVLLKKAGLRKILKILSKIPAMESYFKQNTRSVIAILLKIGPYCRCFLVFERNFSEQLFHRTTTASGDTHF